MLFLTLSSFFFLFLSDEWPCRSQRWAFGPKNIFHSIPVFIYNYTFKGCHNYQTCPQLSRKSWNNLVVASREITIPPPQASVNKHAQVLHLLPVGHIWPHAADNKFHTLAQRKKEILISHEVGLSLNEDKQITGRLHHRKWIPQVDSTSPNKDPRWCDS